MSKESALRLATGNPNAVPTPSLITPETTPKIAVVPEATAAAPSVEGSPAGGDTVVDPALNNISTDRSTIIKKEVEIFKKNEALKKRESEFAAKEKEYNDVIKRVRDFEDLAKKDKVQALKLLGWSDTDIINIVNADPAQPNIQEEARKIAQEETAKIRAEFEEKEKKAASDRDAAIIQNLRNDLKSTLDKNKDKLKFAAMKGVEAEKQAFAVIEENLKLHPNDPILSPEEAMEITNQIYEEEYKAMKGIAEPTPAAEPAPEAVANPRGSLAGRTPVSNIPAPKPRVLSNAISATATSAASSSSARRESREGKKERLINEIKTRGLRK